MHKSNGIVALAALALASACSAQTPLESRLIYLNGKAVQLGDWVSGCDNLGRCTAIGVAPEHPLTGFDAAPYLNMVSRVTLDESISVPPSLEIWPRTDGKHFKKIDQFRGPYWIKGLNPDRGRNFTFYNDRMQAEPEAAFEIIGMMNDRKPVWGIEPDTGEVRVRFAYSGFAELWTAMEAAREKAIIIQEYSARTIRDHEFLPIKTRPPDGSYPRIYESKICDGNTNPNAINRYALDGEKEMLEVKCPAAGTKRISHLYFHNRINGQLTAIEFPMDESELHNVVETGLQNVWVDLRTRMLESTEYNSPARDCGTRWRWGNTSDGWVLIEKYSMPVCRGIMPDDWIPTYRLPYRKIP